MKRKTVKRARTGLPCHVCRKPIPHGTVASKTTTKKPNGEHVDEYVCWRCANPYGFGPSR
jgi:hypothetical protein